MSYNVHISEMMKTVISIKTTGGQLVSFIQITSLSDSHLKQFQNDYGSI